MTVNTSGVQTLQGTFNTGTTFNFDAAATTALTVTDLLVASTSVISTALTDIVTLNFNGSSTAASVLTTLTAATMIDTLNIVSTGSFTTANSIGTFNALATNATVNVSGAQAFTATLPALGTGTFNGASATGKLTITASNNATTVVGGSAADVITGGSVSTSLTGGAGNDTIVGGTAADTITGGTGADSLTGGITGLNTYVFAAGDSLSTGRDTLVDLKEGDIIKFGTALTGLTHAATLSTSTASAIYVDATNNRLVVGNDQITIPASVANAAYTYSSGTDAIVGTIDDSITVGAAPFNASNNGLGKLTLTGKSASTVAVVMSATVPALVNTSNVLNTTNLSTVNTLDASGLTTSGISATSSTAADTITGSSQADTITYLVTANLFTANASVDSIVGGLGTDIIQIGDGVNTPFTIASTGVWTRISGVETIKTVASSGMVSVTLPLTAQTAGITTVDLSLATKTTTNVIDVSAFTTTATTLIGPNATGNADITGGGAADIITAGAAGGTIIGGGAADSITGAGGTDIIKWAATTSAALATETGSTAGGAVTFTAGTVGDKVATWTSGTDKLHFSATLTDPAGTDSETLKVITKGETIANTDRFVHISNTAVGDAVDTTAGAVTVLNALTTSAVTIGASTIVAMDNDTNIYLWLVKQVSTANTIAAQDITLIGMVAGITTVANGDFVSF